MQDHRGLCAALLGLALHGCVPDAWTFPEPLDAARADGDSLDTSPDLPATDAPCAKDLSRCNATCGAAPSALYRAEDDARDDAGPQHASLRNGVSFVPGRFGGAFHLDGAPKYVEIPSEVADFGDGDFTISLWFRTSVGGVLLARRAQCTNGPVTFGEDLGVSPFGHVAVEMFTAVGYFVLRTRPGHADGAWHHTAIVRRGGLVLLTLDGRTEDVHDIAGTFNDPTHTPTFLGVSRCVAGAPGSNGAHDARTWYEGDIDEVAFFRRALTDDELRETALGRCPR